MIYEKYNKLPDGMTSVDVKAAFDELFAEIKATAVLEIPDVLEAIFQLADRQWHTYSILSQEYKDKIEVWVSEHWQSNSLDYVEKAGFIAGAIGLPGVLFILQSELNNPQVREEVRTAILGIIHEIGATIDNPYHEMK